MQNKKYTPEEISKMKERYYTHEQKEYLLSILHKPTPKVIELFKDKYNIELTSCRIKDYRKYYKIRCEKNVGQFKKGHIPTNIDIKPIGYETIYTDGYKWVKLANNHFIQKQRYVWEQHYGKIPKGYNVCFLDHNPLNTDINNLALVKKSVKMIAKNRGLFTKYKDITKTGLLIAELIDKKSKAKYYCS